MQKAGLRRGAFYLVRPDGYLALVDVSGSADRLREYVDAHSVLRVCD
jgi:hypothetical protein